MKQIVVISGKGGTGKTSVVAALASLAKKKILVDCDVDAADLYLIFEPKVREEFDFSASKVAIIDKEKCIECNQCRQACRFKAIAQDFVVDPVACEGCGLCFHLCPAEAIDLKLKSSGCYFVSDTRAGRLVHARLGIAEENSGRLVSLVRKKAQELAKKENSDYILLDGSPGIGCPVIASLTGVDLALIVTEPTLSGVHDLERVVGLTNHFQTKTAVCINKYDINLEKTLEIKEYCAKQKIEVVGQLPYSSLFNKAQMKRQTLLEYAEKSEVAQEIEKIWQKIS
ncbi:MAG: 4Fe-4S binding protein [bacterium]|nr:4Fe-4S binding protein [Candidatus Margulisiibacteriota bacterium]